MYPFRYGSFSGDVYVVLPFFYIFPYLHLCRWNVSKIYFSWMWCDGMKQMWRIIVIDMGSTEWNWRSDNDLFSGRNVNKCDQHSIAVNVPHEAHFGCLKSVMKKRLQRNDKKWEKERKTTKKGPPKTYRLNSSLTLIMTHLSYSTHWEFLSVKIFNFFFPFRHHSFWHIYGVVFILKALRSRPFAHAMFRWVIYI